MTPWSPMQLPERPLSPPDDGPEPTEADLREAREELAERIAGGEKAAGLDLEACLELELNADERVFMGDIAALFRGMYSNTYGTAAFWCACADYAQRIAAKHLSDDAVYEWACEKMDEADGR